MGIVYTYARFGTGSKSTRIMACRRWGADTNVLSQCFGDVIELNRHLFQAHFASFLRRGRTTMLSLGSHATGGEKWPPPRMT
jgi:hypothetical protein